MQSNEEKKVPLEMNKEKLEKLVSLYDKSVKEEKESFEFYGYTLLTSYAKYLIEHCKKVYSFRNKK